LSRIANWWGGISLRVKLYAVLAVSVLSTFGYLLARWKISAASADRAKARADRIEAAQDTEHAIMERQAKVRERAAALRAEIERRKTRDFFEDLP
jgi:C4-dicarboxylate-specific signal transduction histidine kinase